MDRLKLKIGVPDMALTVISLIFLLGMLFAFGPCGPKEDGSWMTCHWAGNAVAGLAGVLFVIALLRLFVPNHQVKAGMSFALIPVSVLTCLIPDRIIHMCMTRDMRCHTVMAPAVTVFGVLLVIVSVVDIVICCGRKRQ